MPTPKDNDIARLSVVLPKDLHEDLLKMAKENGLSVAWVVRHILTDFLKKDHKIVLKTEKKEEN